MPIAPASALPMFTAALHDIVHVEQVVATGNIGGGVMVGGLEDGLVSGPLGHAASQLRDGVALLPKEHPSVAGLTEDAANLDLMAGNADDIVAATSQPWADGRGEQMKAEVSRLLSPMKTDIQQAIDSLGAAGS